MANCIKEYFPVGGSGLLGDCALSPLSPLSALISVGDADSLGSWTLLTFLGETSTRSTGATLCGGDSFICNCNKDYRCYASSLPYGAAAIY
jgi:hypothetical protein